MFKGFDMKGFEDFQTMGKETMDATMESMAAWTKGMQAIAAEVADYSKKSFEDSTAVIEKAMNAKSFEKAFELQADYAKTSSEGMVGEVNTLGEMYLSTAKDAYAPIEKRAQKAA